MITAISTQSAQPPIRPLEQLAKPALDLAAQTKDKVESVSTSDNVAVTVKTDNTGNPDANTKLTAQEQIAQAKDAQQARSEPKTLTQQVDDLNKVAVNNNSRLEFGIDEESGRRMFTIKDRETGKVLNQYPSEPALKVARVITALQAQLVQGNDSLVNESA